MAELHSPACQVRQHGDQCFEVRLHSTRVLLDYGADPSAVLHFLPQRCPAAGAAAAVELGGHWPECGEARCEAPRLAEPCAIDAVLVSSAAAMLALPLLTEPSPPRAAAAVRASRQRSGEFCSGPRLRVCVRACGRNARACPPPPSAAVLASRRPGGAFLCSGPRLRVCVHAGGRARRPRLAGTPSWRATESPSPRWLRPSAAF